LAAKIENGNIPEKILDINGNKVGNIDVVWFIFVWLHNRTKKSYAIYRNINKKI
jgi:hypothetical protein